MSYLADVLDVQCGAEEVSVQARARHDTDWYDVVLTTCPFEGQVDLYPRGGGLYVWACPVCRTEHEVDRGLPGDG